MAPKLTKVLCNNTQQYLCINEPQYFLLYSILKIHDTGIQVLLSLAENVQQVSLMSQ